jgi:hypothetical protein
MARRKDSAGRGGAGSLTTAKSTTFVFHDLAQAVGLLRAAAGAGRAIRLRTAPGAASYAGPLYLMEIANQATAEVPHAVADFEIDCGDEPMAVFAALDASWSHILFTGPKRARDKLVAIAVAQGAAFHCRRSRVTELSPQDDGYAVGRARLGAGNLSKS